MNECIKLVSNDGETSIPLKSTRINGELRDLMSEITVEQAFKNTESQDIEAVYTFPRPHKAVPMELQVILDDRVLDGAVVAASSGDGKLHPPPTGDRIGRKGYPHCD